MPHNLVLPDHIVDAWGLWYLQWQKETKERLRKQALSPQAFVKTHMSEEKLVGTVKK
jgi:hypothetical protein